MAILGGSPLGLIGVTSKATGDGMSTFTGGKSRNTNVNEYNTGKSAKNYGSRSIFYGDRYFRAFPQNSTDPKTSDTPTTDYRISKMHSDSLYDTSVLNILEKLAGTQAELRAQDFAYCKDIGVYPNNRLMIARRFPGGIDNNLFKKVSTNSPGSLSTMISWQPPSAESFFKISFGEKWTEAESDFTDILNEMGDDFSRGLKKKVLGGKGLGDAVGGLGGATSMNFPGFSEVVQIKVLEKLGIFEEGTSEKDLPSGDPNLIKEAKRRVIGSTGLMCSFSVAMTCEWEQKFISGLDPTVVWVDLLSMITRFGTSGSRFYGLGTVASNKIKQYANNPEALIEDVIKVLTDLKDDIVNGIKDVINSIKAVTNPPPAGDTPANGSGNTSGNAAETASLTNAISNLVKEAGTFALEVLKKVVRRYKEKIVGVVNALSGMPSGHWHITIGNPMRPIFCSGDMIIESSGVTVELGPHLAFNDLPSSIKASFTLTPARSLGLQEIMARFNSGYLRSVEYKPSVKEDAYKKSIEGKNPPTPVPIPTTGTGSVPNSVNLASNPLTGPQNPAIPGTSPTRAPGVVPPVSNSLSSVASQTAKPVSDSFNQSGQSSTADSLYNDLNKGNPNIVPGL